MKRLLAILILVVITLCCFTACGKNDNNGSSHQGFTQDSGSDSKGDSADTSGTPSNPPENTKPDSSVEISEDAEAHYLVFNVDGSEVARMLVVSTDTYENLKPYFPTIPEKENYYDYYWEEVEAVYSSEQKEVYINAYQVKKQN